MNRSAEEVTSTGSLIRVDPETQHIVKTIPMASAKPQLVALGDGFVWVVNHATFSITQIDAQANRVVRTIRVGSATRTPCGVAASRRSMWVAIGDAYCDTARR